MYKSLIFTFLFSVSTLILSTTYGTDAPVYNLTIYDVTETAYGATNNDSTDDTAGIQAAINAALSTSDPSGENKDKIPGGIIYFPTGKYYVNTAIQATFTSDVNAPSLPHGIPTSLIFRGEGINNTNIYSTSGNNVFEVTPHNRLDSVTFEDLSILADNYHAITANNGIAIKAAFSSQAAVVSNHSNQGITINQVQIAPSSDDRWFSKGIEIGNGWNTSIRNCVISAGWNTDDMVGIEFVSTSINSIIKDCQISNMATAINIKGNFTNSQEGFRIDDCVLVNVNLGIKSHCLSTDRGYWLSIVDTHIDARGNGSKNIDVAYWDDLYVKNCLLFCTSGTVGSSHNIVANVDRSVIMGNTVHGSNGPNNTSGGIVLTTGSSYNIISNNITYNMKKSYPIWLQSGTDNNRVNDNLILPSSLPPGVTGAANGINNDSSNTTNVIQDNSG